VDIAHLKIIRRASFKAAPWKNGGGITHEAIREPSAGDYFRWRVSIAQIDASGPFSTFGGYDRKMVLLQGAGIELSFGDGETRVLRRVGELVEFDGAVATHCDLIGGPCVDLNLMVDKADGAKVRVEPLTAMLPLHCPAGQTLLLVPIDSAVRLQTAAGEELLEAWDVAILHTNAQLQPVGEGAGVFLAQLQFVSGQ
jgi:environmental stress-induced protein Ves